MRKVVITGQPPVQVLDVTGLLEVFSNAPNYDVQPAVPGPERILQTDVDSFSEPQLPSMRFVALSTL